MNSILFQVRIGSGEGAKESNKLEDFVWMNESTHPWSPRARLGELCDEKENVGDNNNITSLLKGGLSTSPKGHLQVEIELLSIHAQTEFNVCPYNNHQKDVTLNEDDDIFALNDARKIGGLANIALNKKQLDSGGIKNNSRNGSGSSTGSEGTFMQSFDFEGGSWTLQSDLRSSFLRFSFVYDSISRIPRNHLK